MQDQKLKKDVGKTPYSLLPLAELELVVRVYEFGAKKYSPESWRNIPPTEEYIGRIHSALLRHLAEWQTKHVKGEIATDEESGLPTLAHVAWNAIMLLDLVQRKDNNNQTVG